MIETMKIRKVEMLERAMNPGLMATDLAEELVKLGVPFRKAHEKSGSLVKWCEKNKIPLDKVPLEDMKKIIPEATIECTQLFDPSKSVSKREIPGGTGPREVRSRLKMWKRKLSE
jgi:argininosuccinate lyase